MDTKNTGQKTVLLTGGSGFVGSHTADALSAAGYAVRIYDQTPSPYLNPDAGQTMIIGDLLDREALYNAAKGCDYIYHMAGIADIEEANKNPIGVCETNIKGTVQLLEIARELNIKRFIFASTVYVYSERGGVYRVSKQACENFIEVYNRHHDLPFTIIRYGSLYGRRADETNGIHKLIRSALENGEITYNGNPEATREYIHVRDAARLSVDILNEQYENKHIILTGHERMRVADIMNMISEMLPERPVVTFGEQTLAAHYTMTPYVYNPKLGHKLVTNEHIDLGQGILDCIAEIAEAQIQIDEPVKYAAEG